MTVVIREFGSNSTIGNRSEQQDAYFCLPEKGAFGVFDGHGCLGAVASRLAADHIQSLYKYSSSHAPDNLTDEFHDIDDSMPDSGGTTATVVTISTSSSGSKRIVTNNVGDSPAYLIDPHASLERPGVVIDLTTMHDPENEDERRRMIAGGYLVRQTGIIGPDQFYEPTIDRRIGMSRALGDHNYPNILPTPSVNFLSSRRERLLLIASDGVINERTYSSALEDLQRMFHRGSRMAEIVVALTTKYAQITKDNATAIVLHLPAV